MNNGITRDEALALVNDWTKNKNLVKHMLAVEAEMRALCQYFCENGLLSEEEKQDKTCAELVEAWGLLGLIHDADYEKWPDKHPKKTIEELEGRGAPDWLIHGVKAHAWHYNGMDVEPSNKMEWAIYTCDELSGFIIACALVRPDRKLASVTVDSVLKKWPAKAFAKGVHREQIELCQEKLNIPLKDFIEINLKALQSIAGELGL